MGDLDYVIKVKEAITSTKSAALTFKRAGRVEVAKQALMRVKIMTGEVEEVEQAIAEGEM